MLVLSRRPGEALLIGETRVVILERSSSGKVRLGIDAPLEVEILREEILARRAAQPTIPSIDPQVDVTPCAELHTTLGE